MKKLRIAAFIAALHLVVCAIIGVARYTPIRLHGQPRLWNRLQLMATIELSSHQTVDGAFWRVLSYVIGQQQNTSGGNSVAQNFSGGVLNTPGSLNCAIFNATDDSLRLQACLTALGALYAQGAGAHAENMTGCVWSVDPFDAPSLSAAGQLWLPACTMTTPLPIKLHNDWTIHGTTQGRSVPGQVGSTIQAAATFPVAYSTGTITVGTAGASEIITGSGTTWATPTIQPGCAFVAPAGVNTNNTFGVIKSITDTTHIVLGFGANNGTGAAGGSGYVIYCPVVIRGIGVSAATPYQFAMTLDGVGIDCAGTATVVGLMSWYAQQFAYLHNVMIRNCGNHSIGYDKENQEQQAGPDDGVIIGACGTNGTNDSIAVVVRPPFGIIPFEFKNFTLTGGGTCNNSVLVDVQGDNTHWKNIDCEGVFVDCIKISGNTSPPTGLAFAMPNRVTTGTVIDEIHNFNPSAATNLVHISNGVGTPNRILIYEIEKGGGQTNALTDDINGCTEPSSRLSEYHTDGSGRVAFSTSSVNQCSPLSNFSAATLLKSETAADASVLSFTPTTQNGTYRIHFALDVSAASAATLGWTATWTDSNGTAQAPTNLSICSAATGTCAATTGAISAAGDFGGSFDVNTNNSGTAIVVKLTFSGTSFTAKASATIERLQ